MAKNMNQTDSNKKKVQGNANMGCGCENKATYEIHDKADPNKKKAKDCK